MDSSAQHRGTRSNLIATKNRSSQRLKFPSGEPYLSRVLKLVKLANYAELMPTANYSYIRASGFDESFENFSKLVVGAESHFNMLPSQKVPFPRKLLLQTQMKLPGVLKHRALGSQL